MNPMTIISICIASVGLIALSIVLVKQGTVVVITRFGRYHKIMKPGLSFRIPLIDVVTKRQSLQNRSVELEFQSITADQANVNFKTLILFCVQDDREETIKRATFKFIDEKSFMQSLIRSIEGSIRSFVAVKKQSEVLSLRREIVNEVKNHIDDSLNDWGFHLIDLQVNDISFDEAIMRSMAQVVATNNLKAAAENEAQAQYITKTRIAQAEGQAKMIVAEAEKVADNLKGEGNALLRKNIAEGLALAQKTMLDAHVDPALMQYAMWLDTMKNVAAHGKGNLISFDGSMEGFEKTVKQMQVLSSHDRKSVA